MNTTNWIIIYTAILIIAFFTHFAWYRRELRIFRRNLKPGDTILIDYNGKMIFARFVQYHNQNILFQFFDNKAIRQLSIKKVYQP
jgi:hypothetical protein